jgi:hypothetical protein
MPPAERPALDAELGRADHKVYVVIGAEADTAWDHAKIVLADYALTELFLATSAGAVDDLATRDGVGGWPEGTDWAGGTPCAICFGRSADPVFYLTQEQAEDLDVIAAAYTRAQELTGVGGGA